MKKLQMQTNYNGEWFTIWETDAETLEMAWSEIDREHRPTAGGWIRFCSSVDEQMAVNGGF
jgi:hypothetical protein